MKIRAVLLSWVCLSAACGCARIAQPVSVAQFRASLLPTLVATKIQTPLYLVVSESEVPDRVHVTGMQIAIFTVPDLDLVQVRTFATRDLKHALESYFAHVNLIFDPAQLPSTPHLRGDVRLTKIEYQRQISAGYRGQQNELFGAVEWAFGIKVSSQADFVYKFSERTISARQMTSFSDVSEFESAFEEALRHLLADYDRSGMHARLLAGEAASTLAPAPAP